MGSPAVSVVIPTYNRAAIVTDAIDSALACARPGDEVLVVDDGSTDDTGARVRAYGAPVRLVAGDHAGPGAARNRGVREARNPLVAFLDSDDVFMPDKLELQRAVLAARPDVLFCFSDFAHRTRDGRELRRCLVRWHGDARGWDAILGPGVPFSSLAPLPAGRADFRVHEGDLYERELHGDYVCTSTVVVRKAEAGAALRFAEDLRRFQDWECFGRLAGAGRAAYLDCETQWNRDHAGARLTRADEVYCESARLAVLERVWGSDPAFLERHGERYRAVVGAHRRARAKALLAEGRTAEARSDFRTAGYGGLADRVLAALPGPVVRALVSARRRLRPRKRFADLAA